MDTLQQLLQAILDAFGANIPPISTGQGRPFVVPTNKKGLRERDMVLIDMLNSVGHEDVSFCVCDPAQKDCPIVFASDGFCRFTGYSSSEIEGRNCRFLQGTDTAPADVDKIRSAIRDQREASVNLLNYRKDGTPFNNQFFLSPLYDTDGSLLYFIGVQCSVAKLGPGQAPVNCGWVYSQGLPS